MRFTFTPRARRTALRALAAATILAAVVTAAVPTYSLDTRHTGARDNRGFPKFYTDDRGIQLGLCESGTVRCQGVRRGDLVPPEGEAFYWMATAHIRSSRGPVDVEFALEAAFAGRRPIVFDRIRIRGHLNQRGGYILDHPYGSTPFRAITPVEQRNVDTTHDRNCSLERRGRCPGLITNFLRARNAPRGFLGFGGRATQVKFGTFRNSVVLRTADGTVLGETDRFVIIGRIRGRLG